MCSKYILLLLIYAINYCFNGIFCENTIIVETKLGSVKGTVIEFNNKTLNQFLGIPYAEPPVGSSRFGKPKPVQKWNNTLVATHVKNICWQTSTEPKKLNQSEDCLFLNIWSENKNQAELRPVMFYIHGGGFHNGNGYIAGMSLASFGVVMVSINYRLGAFGFLYGNDPSAPGNVGIYDQILALKWVNDNIEHFGGDPSQITIFGQSAGSWSVSALIVSPLSRNLFRRAIMQSGAYNNKHYHNYSSSYQLSTAHKLSKTIGCENNKWLDCLRKVEPKVIQEKNSHNIMNSSLVFGDEILPITLEEALKTGKFKSGIEVMAGVTESEGTSWALGGSFGSNKLSNICVHITKEELKTQIKAKFNSESDAFIDKVYDYYISHVDESNQTLLRKSYIAILSDTVMKYPTYHFVEKLAQFSAKNKVYFYELTYNNKNSSCYGQEWKGICHSDDLAFVFSIAINDTSMSSEDDYKFSVMVNKLWTNFAKNGNPLSHSVINTLGENVINWPTFRDTDHSPVSPKVMELNPRKFGHLFTDPFQSNCDELWKQYYEIE